MSQRPITFGSLFSGCGLMDLGFERAGLQCLWQCEIDRYARRALAHHWPSIPCHEDVRQIGRHNLAPVDVIVGGFPCQSVSVAGKRAGFADDTKSGLFFEMARIVDELRPAFVVFENVPGLLSSFSPVEPPPDAVEGSEWEVEEDSDFEAVLYELDRLGYCGAVTGLDARFFGVAQQRFRLFGVFARNDFGAGCCAEILALRDRRKGYPAPCREEESDAAAESGGRSQDAGVSGTGEGDENRVAGCLNFGNSKGGFRTEPGEHLIASSIDASIRYGVGDNAAQANHVIDFHVTQDPISGDVAPSMGTGNKQGCGTIGVLYQANGSGSEGAGPPTLAASDDNGTNQIITHALTSQGADASEDGTGRGTPLVVQQPLPLNGDTAYCLPSAARGTGDGHGQGWNSTYVGMPAPNQETEKVVAIRTAQTSANGHGISENLSHTLDGAQGQCVAFTELGEGHVTYQETDIASGMRTSSGGGEQKANIIAFQERGRDGRRTLDSQEDISYALTAPPSVGRGQERNIAAGMMVRRLTPAECLRLMGAPDMTNSCIIWACSEHQKKNVLAEGRSPKSPLSAWIAHLPRVEIKNHKLALFADNSSPQKCPVSGRLVVTNAVLSSVDGLISSECTPSDQYDAAKIADGRIAFTRRGPSDDFVRLAARMNSCLDQIARHGRGGKQNLQQSEFFTPLGNGNLLVVVSGEEIVTLASGAKDITRTVINDSSSIISPVGKNSLSCDWNLPTLSSCAVLATDSSIPEQIRNGTSFVLNLNVLTTWLDLDPPLSDSAKYRLCGNGVVVTVAFWLASRLERAARRVLENL